MKKPFHIEAVTEGDIEEIIQLGTHTPQCQDHDGPPEFLPPEILRGYIKSPDDIFLKAVDPERKLMGIVMVPYNKYSKVAYLENIIVKPAFRKIGLASELVKQVSKLLKKRGCHGVWGLVHEDNEVMLDFLKNRNFKRGRKFYLVEKLLDDSEE